MFWKRRRPAKNRTADGGKALATGSGTPADDNVQPVPLHVAIIMDGNGRWARMRGLSRIEGHRAGTENIRRVIRAFATHGVKYLTLYAFSTENWSRPDEEVRGLFRILAEVIDRELENLHKEGVKLLHLGDLSRLPAELQSKVRKAIARTKDNTGLTLSLAFNYGGRDDIVQAVRHIVAEGIPPQDVDEDTISRHLYTDGIPDPDLIIRTAGELRLSNFLIWQAAYSEYHYTETLWPDFAEQDIVAALAAYGQRQRRFGGLTPNGGKGS